MTVVLFFAPTCAVSGNSFGDSAIWAPAWANATHVLLLPPAQPPSWRSDFTDATVRVSAAQSDPDGAPRHQKLLASYRLFVNGVFVGIGPGRGNVPLGNLSSPGSVIYDQIVIPAAVLALRAGAPSVALQCFGRSGGNLSSWAMLELRATDAAGAEAVVLRTGPGWRAYGADAIFAPGVLDTCKRANEDLNASAALDVAGWREPGYVATGAGWVAAEARTPLTPPVPKTTAPLAVVDDRAAPQTVTRVGPAHWFVDFGREQMGALRLTVPAATAAAWGGAGARLRVLMSEQRNTSSTTAAVLVPSSSGQVTNSTFHLAAQASEVEMHEFVGMFRYAELRALDAPMSAAGGEDEQGEEEPPPFNLSRWTVAYPWREGASSFVSSDPMLNDVWALCAQTVRHTSLDVFTDSNTRERAPYEADGYNTARARWALQDEYAWARHSTQHVLNNPTWPTEWKQYTALLVHEHWLQTGDASLAAANWDLLLNNSMRAFISPASGLVDWSTGATCGPAHWEGGGACHLTPGTFPPGVTDGGRSYDIVDWQPSYRDGFNFTSVNVVVNAFCVRALELLAELAGPAGRPAAEGDALAAQAVGVRSSMLARMFDAPSGHWCDGLCSATGVAGSFHSQHIPLWLGLTPATAVLSAHAYLASRGLVGSTFSAFSLLHGLQRAARRTRAQHPR